MSDIGRFYILTKHNRYPDIAGTDKIMDKFNRETRSEIMSRIRSTETKCELALQKPLDDLGFKYQVRVYGIKVDLANKIIKIGIFVDGCFWYYCPVHGSIPKSNREFWEPKLKKEQGARHRKCRKAYP